MVRAGVEWWAINCVIFVYYYNLIHLFIHDYSGFIYDYEYVLFLYDYTYSVEMINSSIFLIYW